nr:DUF3126 family protein [Agrobacterium sp. a22-2]
MSLAVFTGGFSPCDKRRDLNRGWRILVKPEEIKKLDAYFKRMFGSTMVVKARPRKDDSAEVYLGDEFLGIVFRDDEDGDLSFNFSMAILDVDL